MFYISAYTISCFDKLYVALVPFTRTFCYTNTLNNEFYVNRNNKTFLSLLNIRSSSNESRMSAMLKNRIFVGPFLHSTESGELVTENHAAIYVKDGKIDTIVTDPSPIVSDDTEVMRLGDGQFLVPGFIDCHIHSVQFPNMGIGYDKKLLDWLETYTFPLEKQYKTASIARHVFDTTVRQTLMQGTTTACYFASLYAEASAILGETAADLGQRALVGKITMNAKRSDEYYETTEESIENMNKFIARIESIDSPLIKPIITPRFALSCDMRVMKELGKLAKQKNLHIQSHICENVDEIEAVKNKFPECSSYAAVYDAAGLLTNKTVMAHGIHLTDDEITLLKDRGTAVIHCPSSNTCLKSGLCDVQRLKAKGLKIGLGTDVAGGQSSSILDAMKSALQVSSHLSILKDDYKALNYKDVFYMATLGGAKALAMDDKIGTFKCGKEFDALVIDTNASFPKILKHDSLEEKLQKFIYSGDDRNIIAVYVSGRKVK